MREIKLVNNEGEEFDLTRPDACLQDISGIGMEIEFETVRIGQCDVVVDEQPQYNPVSGMIPFMDKAIFPRHALSMRRPGIVR